MHFLVNKQNMLLVYTLLLIQIDLETFSHILNYPQRPIVTTRFKKYTDVDKLPYGVNAVVAIVYSDIIK